MTTKAAHPLRGGLSIPGGVVFGVGAGLAAGHVTAGVLAGAGLGMVLCACLRAFGKW